MEPAVNWFWLDPTQLERNSTPCRRLPFWKVLTMIFEQNTTHSPLHRSSLRVVNNVHDEAVNPPRGSCRKLFTRPSISTPQSPFPNLRLFHARTLNVSAASEFRLCASERCIVPSVDESKTRIEDVRVGADLHRRLLISSILVWRAASTRGEAKAYTIRR